MEHDTPIFAPPSLLVATPSSPPTPLTPGFIRHSVKFRTAAKDTHTRYGTSIHPATMLTRRNATSEQRIAVHSTRITASA